MRKDYKCHGDEFLCVCVCGGGGYGGMLLQTFFSYTVVSLIYHFLYSGSSFYQV